MSVSGTIDGVRTTDQGETRIGIRVVDNNGAEHGIEMDTHGEIYIHQCDAYADKAADRTPQENEYNEQARRYAKYYVFRERGYPTIEPRQLPEWLVVVASAVAQLSPRVFEVHFGDYHQQLRSVVEPDVDPIVDVPEDDVAGLRVYLLNVHLDIDFEERLDEETLAELTRTVDSTADPDAVIQEIADALSGRPLDPDQLSIAGVSDVGVLYQGQTKEIEQEGDDPHPGPADARLELSPTGTPGEQYLSTEEFQILVVHHLLCQARDCYLQMGLEPPEPLRVLGLGRYRQTVRNEHLEMYEPVHGTTEAIEGYSLPEIGSHLEPNSV
ncbi:hypothetical protein [Natranaeroarchaeum aerophilus]|uniref:Uncharacterized protein n=1 Tax=Natranaeroarchaeum aerophilus TaxID=2917711 RepID=A0AAE3K3U0_9EURY|nr:hypothetical protein [Natranaeroarchaeum aerophilus]MCL9812050.1 hypothetical protein [Natranaeroarchaeum aerophilus]